MNTVKLVNKPPSTTSLQVVELFRKKLGLSEDVKLSYADRLDPMARGLMILLIGEENKERQKYLGLDKEYEFKVLFGVSTDSYDILGYLNNDTPKTASSGFNLKLKKIIPKFIGKIDQPFPPYSSKPINGKALFYWAKNNLLDKVKIPSKTVNIYSLELITADSITTSHLKKEIIPKIKNLKGDFRQEETLKKWKNLFNKHPNQIYKTASFKIRCSSGTYVRSIANEMGKITGLGAITLDIKRIRIGDFLLDQSLNITS